MNALLQLPTGDSQNTNFFSQNISNTKSGETSDFFESIIANIISEDSENGNSAFLLSKILNLPMESEKIEETILDFRDETLQADETFTAITIQELLQIAVTIKNGEDPATFPTDNSSLKLALSNADVVEEFKNAKTIKDILDIAKTNDIEVKNFEFFKEEAALDPIDKKAVQKIKSEEIFKLIEQNLSNSSKSVSTNALLQSADKTAQIKSDTPASILQSILTSKAVDKSQPNNQKNSQQSTTTISTNSAPLTDNIEASVAQVQKVASPTSIKEIQNIAASQHITEDDSAQIPKPTTQLNSEEDAVEESIKNSAKTTFESMLTKERQPVQNIQAKAVEPQQTVTAQQTENTTEPTESIDVKENSEPKTLSTQETKTQTIEKDKPIFEAKRTFNTFAEEFKEKVESYKPPLMKIKMELKPGGLGEVDVTLINRGNNLQVNVNSNANTIALFSQNQAEFKNALVNMGFSDLQMNFGERQQKEQEQQNRQQQNFSSFEETQEEMDGFEMIVPQYV